MKIPNDPDRTARYSMELLGVQPGEDWDIAINKLANDLLTNGDKNLHHVFQVIIGERIDAGESRSKEWVQALLLPIALKQEALILFELNLIANITLEKD